MNNTTKLGGNEVNEKILRIAQLCLDINEKTNHAAVFEIIGFINGVDVTVRESKKNYTESDFLIKYDSPVYLDWEWYNVDEELNKVIADLEGFLNGEVKEAI